MLSSLVNLTVCFSGYLAATRCAKVIASGWATLLGCVNSDALLAVISFANRSADFRPKIFGFSARSLIPILVLGGMAAVFFVKLYLREWQLKRGFRRFCEKKQATVAGAPAARAPEPLRKPLIATTRERAKPAALEPGLTKGGADTAAKRLGPVAPYTATYTQGSVPSGNAKCGTLEVQSDDELCEVFVDSSFVGNSPAKLRLAEGLHRVEVKKPGHLDYSREVRVIEGSELTVRAALERKSDERTDAQAAAYQAMDPKGNLWRG